MCFFHKKKNSEKVQQDREIISENERTVDALIVLAANDQNLISEFKQMKEQLKYLIASNNEKVIDFDKKIKNLIADLRIVLVKNDSDVSIKANKMIAQIKLAIVDRNANL